MSSRPKEKVKVYLALRSGGICAYPNCRVRLTAGPVGSDEGAVIAEAAHIFGEKPGSARFDPSKSIELLNSAENLIYLCPNHHTLIDKQPETYTVRELFSWKYLHETKVWEAITSKTLEVTYDEFAIAIQSTSRKELLQQVEDAQHLAEYHATHQGALGQRQNSLAPILTELGQEDREVRRRVLGYCRWYDPASKAEIHQRLALFGGLTPIGGPTPMRESCAGFGPAGPAGA